MSNNSRYDAIVIGSGQAGTPLSQALANAGMRTALVELVHVGGTCVNEGCTPTKTMVASGRVAYLARRGAEYGVDTGSISIDMVRVRQRKRDIVNSFRAGSEKRIAATANLNLIYGEASFTGPKSIRVVLRYGGEQSLTAERFFINAGCRPSVPKLSGLDHVPYFNSTSIMELDAVPEHLLVLGGGYIGLEFGQLFRRLGSRVTIVQSGAQLLAREDKDIADAVEQIVREDGIELLLNANAQSVSHKDSKITLHVQGEDGERQLEGSHLLVATGRVPNTDSLNVSAAGVTTDKRGFLIADEKLETNVPAIFALGDIKGGPQFTHISYDDFRIIRSNVIEGKDVTIKDRIIPYTVFIDPQLGRVGITEQQAREKRRKIRVAKMPMSYVARALEVDETRGFMKAVVDTETDQILGAAVLGIEGGEIMAQLQIAMMGKLPYTALRDGIFAHPTLAESLNNLFNNFQGEPAQGGASKSSGVS